MTNLIRKRLSAFSLGICKLRRGTSVSLLSDVTLPVLTLLVMRHLTYFPLSSPPNHIQYIPTCVPSVSGSVQSKKPLQVYVCWRKLPVAQIPIPPSSSPSGDSSPAQSIVSSSSAPVDPVSYPIALLKGKRSCTSHRIAQFVSYDNLSRSLCAFTVSITAAFIPKLVSEALYVPC